MKDSHQHNPRPRANTTPASLRKALRGAGSPGLHRRRIVRPHVRSGVQFHSGQPPRGTVPPGGPVHAPVRRRNLVRRAEI